MLKRLTLLLFLSMISSLSGCNFSNFLKSLPIDHKNSIEYLFYNIFLQQDGAFTIFGDKPVSCAANFVTSSLETTLLYPGQVGKLARSLKVWSQYKDQFPMEKYLLISEICSIKKTGSDVIFIFIINRKKLIETLNNNLMLFEVELNRKIDSHRFLNDLETGKTTFLKNINRHEMLLGILLGYGNHDALLFYKRSKRPSPFLPPPKSKVKLHCSNNAAHPMLIVNPVQYMTDIHHLESINLQKKYKSLHEKISQIYSHGNFLEITFAQLMSSN